MSGRAVAFRTAVAVVGPNGRQFTALDTTTVRFRTLGQDEIARYVDAEQPFDCAGSFKAEGLGIALFEAIESRDPTARSSEERRVGKECVCKFSSRWSPYP